MILLLATHGTRLIAHDITFAHGNGSKQSSIREDTIRGGDRSLIHCSKESNDLSLCSLWGLKPLHRRTDVYNNVRHLAHLGAQFVFNERCYHYLHKTSCTVREFVLLSVHKCKFFCNFFAERFGNSIFLCNFVADQASPSCQMPQWLMTARAGWAKN